MVCEKKVLLDFLLLDFLLTGWIFFHLVQKFLWPKKFFFCFVFFCFVLKFTPFLSSSSLFLLFDFDWSFYSIWFLLCYDAVNFSLFFNRVDFDIGKIGLIFKFTRSSVAFTTTVVDRRQFWNFIGIGRGARWTFTPYRWIFINDP